MIARALAIQTFNRRHLVVVPNCTWTGHECDLLVVTENLRIIDVEIKISRADLKADAKKEKWWRYLTPEEKLADIIKPQSDIFGHSKVPAEWPLKVWKHYYAMPAEIWKPELIDCISPLSGILLLTMYPSGGLGVKVLRMAKPNKNAEKISAASAIDIARLASLRMWDSFLELDAMKSKS